MWVVRFLKIEEVVNILVFVSLGKPLDSLCNPFQQMLRRTLLLETINIRGFAMFNLSLTACSFHFRKANARRPDRVYGLNQPFVFSNEDGEEVRFDTITELFELFFQKYEQMYTDDKKKQTFSCDYDSASYEENDSYRMFYVRIQSGVYGSSSDILDGVTKKTKLKKKSDDIEVRPFYLFFFVPKDTKNVTVQKGILIFQNVGQFGIKTITTELMQDFFSSTFGVTMRCATISPDLFIKKVIKKESIRKFVMIKNMKSADVADNCEHGYGKEVREIADLRFSENLWAKMMLAIQWVAGGKARLFEFENQKYDTLKLVVDIGGRTRKIDLHNLDRLSIIEAIPEEIRMADGHPNLDMLIEHFKQVASEYISEMVLSIT